MVIFRTADGSTYSASRSCTALDFIRPTLPCDLDKQAQLHSWWSWWPACVLSTLRHNMFSAVHDILHALAFIVQIYARYTTIRASQSSARFQTDLDTIWLSAHLNFCGLTILMLPTASMSTGAHGPHFRTYICTNAHDAWRYKDTMHCWYFLSTG